MVNVLIAAATELELKSFFSSDLSIGGVNLISAVLGVGKCAGWKLTRILSKYEFELVLLVGSCGSDELVSGTIVTPVVVVSAERKTVGLAIQTDMIFRSLVNARDPLCRAVTLVEVEDLVQEPPCEIINMSGIVYDMESYAIAEACRERNVALGILKVVIDGREDSVSSIDDYLQLESGLYGEISSNLKVVFKDVLERLLLTGAYCG